MMWFCIQACCVFSVWRVGTEPAELHACCIYRYLVQWLYANWLCSVFRGHCEDVVFLLTGNHTSCCIFSSGCELWIQANLTLMSVCLFTSRGKCVDEIVLILITFRLCSHCRCKSSFKHTQIFWQSEQPKKKKMRSDFYKSISHHRQRWFQMQLLK